MNLNFNLHSFPTGIHYAKEGLISNGSFGAVYRGRSSILPQQIAIKIANGEREDHNLWKESQHLSACKESPYFAEYHDAWRGPAGRMFMVMELTSSDLLALLRLQTLRKGRNSLSRRTTLHIAQEVLQGLKFLHQKVKLVHNDLKLDNLAVALNNPKRIKILDLGLAEKYEDERGRHLPIARAPYRGTHQFSSLRKDQGYRGTRKDDMESFAYLILLCQRRLPWIADTTKETIMQKKKELLKLDRSKELRKWTYCFSLLLKWVMRPRVNEEPDYARLQLVISRAIFYLKDKNPLLDWES